MGRSWLRTHFDPHAAVGVYFVVLTLLMCWTAVHMSFGSKVDPWMTKVLGGKEAEMVRPVASRESASFKWHTGPTNLFASSSSNRKTVRQVVAVSRSLIRSPASCVVSKTAVASREDRGSISTSMLFTPVRSRWLAIATCLRHGAHRYFSTILHRRCTLDTAQEKNAARHRYVVEKLTVSRNKCAGPSMVFSSPDALNLRTARLLRRLRSSGTIVVRQGHPVIGCDSDGARHRW